MTAIVTLSGAAGCGCFAEVYARLRRSQGLVLLLLVFEELMRDPMDQIFLSTGLYIPLLGAILRNAIDQGRHWGVRILEMGHLPQ